MNVKHRYAENFSEDEALRRAQQGDPDAFESIYRRHSSRVYSLCLRMVKNPTHAEDLTQDTFLAVFRGIREFRGQSAFSTWLHRVTRNTVLMGFRKRRLQETSLDEIVDPESDASRAIVELGITDARLEGTADRMLLREALNRLSRGFRATLLLHDLHGYEHSEVAAILGCATGTSKSQLHKARLRIRQMLVKGTRRSRIKGIRRDASAASARLAA
ncbi:MAG TPA: sigma-70 family RNA polymerase sigma factor [Candidatus Saccharimonadales bacterium]|nr:sigma-70 family RNA polymerase sigma factor [Candidatus Saccharimonadales bacterium]